MDQSDIGANVYFAAAQDTDSGSTATGNSTAAVVGATRAPLLLHSVLLRRYLI